jgi:hypothetical protein
MNEGRKEIRKEQEKGSGQHQQAFKPVAKDPPAMATERKKTKKEK